MRNNRVDLKALLTHTFPLEDIVKAYKYFEQRSDDVVKFALVFEPFAEKARASGWEVAELKTGHDCHVELPSEVAKILLSAVPSQ